MAGKSQPHDDGTVPARKLSKTSTALGGQRPGIATGEAGGVAVLMSPEALSNNERLFPAFKTHLSDPTQGGPFLNSAEKLAGWASKDKAYYPAARPWVSAPCCRIGPCVDPEADRHSP